MAVHKGQAHVIVMTAQYFKKYTRPFQPLPQTGVLSKTFHVFISYRVAANQSEAQRICEELQRRTVMIYKSTRKASEQHECVGKCVPRVDVILVADQPRPFE